MTWFKLLVPLLTAVIGIAQVLLQFKLLKSVSFTDRRTTRHRLLAALTSIGLLALAGLTAMIIWEDGRSQTEQTTLLRGQSAQLAQQTDELSALNQQISGLEVVLAPFRDLASTRYPSIPETAALAHLADDIRELSERTGELELRANTIHSMQVQLLIDLPTNVEETTEGHTSVGLQSVIALYDVANTRYRFATDYQFSHQQVSPRTFRLSFVYEPESREQVFGKQISFLSKMDKLVLDLSQFLLQIGVAVDQSEPTRVSLSVRVNGVQVVELDDLVAAPGVLSTGQAVLDVASAFKQLPQRYAEQVRSMAN